MVELMEIIGARLTDDVEPGGVNEPELGATAGFHNGKAPENTGYDRVVVKHLTGLPRHTFTDEYARRCFIQFMVYTIDPANGGETGTAKATRLNKRIQYLFSHKAEEINDPSLVSSLLDSELALDSTEDSSGRTIYSEGCIMEMWTV